MLKYGDELLSGDAYGGEVGAGVWIKTPLC